MFKGVKRVLCVGIDKRCSYAFLLILYGFLLSTKMTTPEMKTDVQEHDDHYEVDIDLPGFQKEELSLELKDGYLVVSAAKGLSKDEEDKKTGRFVRRERYAGSMSRSFYVGEEVKQEDIRARYESGVLKLAIPKPEEKKPQVEEKKYIAIEG